MNPTLLHADDWPAAIAQSTGPQLVLAGPGTGKTEFLARRVAHLVEAGTQPDAMAVLTFSRRAARRLTSRIRSLTNGLAPRATTFHSLAYRLLETWAPNHLEWSRMPTLLTGPEQVSVVRQLLADESLDSWSPTFRPILHTQTFAREVADFLMRSSEYLLDDESLAARCVENPDWRGLARFRRRYRHELQLAGRIDYGALQAEAIHLLERDSVRESAADQYRFVVVDEYQDTTAAQARMIRLLADPHGNLTVAGDPTQSIYRFRGAAPDNVEAFTVDATPLGALTVFELTESFRCPSEILVAASRVLEAADDQTPLSTEPAEHTGSVEAYTFSQASEEAEWIAGEIQRMALSEDLTYSRFAVLVRSKRGLLNELSRALSRRSIAHNQPDARLVDHPAVRTVFDLAFAAAHDNNYRDVGIVMEVDRAVRRILLGPLFGLSLGAERRALRARHVDGAPWSKVVQDLVPDGAGLAELLGSSEWATALPAADGFWHAWTTLPQYAAWVTEERSELTAALASFGQSLERLRERDPNQSLFAYRAVAEADDFEAEPLLSIADPSVDQVMLTTLHQAKGLEFDVVFIADATDDLFPDLRRQRTLLEPHRLATDLARDADGHDREQLREEGRLAYTAMTRASRRVVWTATSAGFDMGDVRPSRFLSPAVAGAEVGTPPDTSARPPLTYLEAEAHLRRIAGDPEAPAPHRLAAVEQLVRRPNPGLRRPVEFTMIRPKGPDTGVIVPPIRLSPSQAEKYASCPRRYALERRLAVDADYGFYGSFGSLMHEVLELADRAAWERGDARSTRADAQAALEQAFDRYELDVGERRRAWRRRADRLIAALYDDWIRPDAVPVLLEHPLSLTIGGVEWIGRADRIEKENGLVRVVDYKTSTTAMTKQDAAVSLQLGFYLLAARHDPDVQQHGVPSAAELWYPLARSGPTRRSLDVARLPEVEEQLRDIARAIAAEEWQPRVSPDCERCSVRLVCPAFPEGREAFVR